MLWREDDKREWDILHGLDFGEMVPRSKIVYGELGDEYAQILKVNRFHNGCQQKIAEFKLSDYGLYQKYIAVGSEYEINIAYGVRKTLSDMMGNIDLWMNNDLHGCRDDAKKGLLFLFETFDIAIDETRALLQFSFSRLQASPAYRAYVKMTNKIP